MFFVTYAAFEVPANIMIKKLDPSTWISIIMILWGIVRLRVPHSELLRALTFL